MPRWKALPDELDPQIKEFMSQLRQLVDRSGLSIAALADRTGYSRTSWERYLNGRLLAPKGAVVALAEATGTDPVHLTTLWELAERAWSRAEMRHDSTMEAIRISQARAALGEAGGDAPGAEANGSRTSRESGGATTTARTPKVPAQPTASDADAREGTAKKSAPASASGTRTPASGNSWNVAGYRGPSRAGGRPPGTKAAPPPAPLRPGGPGHTQGLPASPGPYAATTALPGPRGGSPQASPPASGGAAGGRGQPVLMFFAGLVAALVLIGVVFSFSGLEINLNAGGASASPSPSGTQPDLPPGVKCKGDGCTGKDAERMGCSGERATTVRSVTVGATFLEIRHSETCGAAWARITRAVPGDEVQVTVGSHKETGGITKDGESIAYTPMIAVKDAAQATACATLVSGQRGCTP
ncbi:hypothetical protein STXM2123_2744 [Streptomyces sp. F-3]|jgi:transcriptional regulator with XRE-family HTH domain|uniref:XRE family transcriptional regulator n=1 Tax=Streptomyces thermogriseus TaxID=75292 RepID=A0ABN1T1X5_9ACTN|nr:MULTISPECIES: XRE family transcriptional regulator [Streptomyces]MDN5381687.1 DUF2690 domain-containing protein [Streptomyces sp. LB8]GAT82043.1 hypothetical protein STXM2123_2744 [Streptomyces sp. F-3]